jgi:hypothetical protein
MPCLRKELLEAQLRTFRYGALIRCHLSTKAYQKTLHVRDGTKRTIQDIIRVVLDVYNRYEFPFQASKGSVIIAFRYNREAALALRSRAWSDKMYRSRFIGGIVEAFMKKVPEGTICRILKQRLDQTSRLFKEAIRG